MLETELIAEISVELALARFDDHVPASQELFRLGNQRLIERLRGICAAAPVAHAAWLWVWIVEHRRQERHAHMPPVA
jgi:hypothetical protein